MGNVVLKKTKNLNGNYSCDELYITVEDGNQFFKLCLYLITTGYGLLGFIMSQDTRQVANTWEKNSTATLSHQIP